MKKSSFIPLLVILVIGFVSFVSIRLVENKIAHDFNRGFQEGLIQGFMEGVDKTWRCQRARVRGHDMLQFDEGQCVWVLSVGDRY